MTIETMGNFKGISNLISSFSLVKTLKKKLKIKNKKDFDY